MATLFYEMFLLQYGFLMLFFARIGEIISLYEIYLEIIINGIYLINFWIFDNFFIFIFFLKNVKGEGLLLYIILYSKRLNLLL